VPSLYLPLRRNSHLPSPLLPFAPPRTAARPSPTTASPLARPATAVPDFEQVLEQTRSQNTQLVALAAGANASMLGGGGPPPATPGAPLTAASRALDASLALLGSTGAGFGGSPLSRSLALESGAMMMASAGAGAGAGAWAAAGAGAGAGDASSLLASVDRSVDALRARSAAELEA
jgi:hypothetical protein